MLKIPCILFRGGTSKGPFFLKADLPEDSNLRNELLLRIMGSPDKRQIDGIGGGHSLSSKTAIVAPSNNLDWSLIIFFCQVYITKPIVETALNCVCVRLRFNML